MTMTVFFLITPINKSGQVILGLPSYVHNIHYIIVAPVTEKIRSNRLAWYEHVMRRDESHINKRVISMNVDGQKP
jgi:hypothetical protein